MIRKLEEHGLAMAKEKQDYFGKLVLTNAEYPLAYHYNNKQKIQQGFRSADIATQCEQSFYCMYSQSSGLSVKLTFRVIRICLYKIYKVD